MRKLMVLAASTALSGTVAVGAAQAFPDGTVEMVIPFSAGGGTDIVARAFEPGFAEALGTNVVIRNVDGASGTIGAAEAANAEADGHTIGYLPIGPTTIQPHLRSVPYDIDSWEFVCLTTNNPVLLLVSEDSEFETIEDLMAAAEDGRADLVYGSSGPGTIPHVAMVATTGALDLEARHLPYEGTGPAMSAMAGGEIQLFADTPAVLEQHSVRALAAFAPERLDALPDVPTMAEIGHDLNFSVWQGIFAPAGTPEDRVEALSAACEAGAENERFLEIAADSNTNVEFLGASDFEQFARDSYETNRTLLEEAGLTE